MGLGLSESLRLLQGLTLDEREPFDIRLRRSCSHYVSGRPLSSIDVLSFDVWRASGTIVVCRGSDLVLILMEAVWVSDSLRVSNTFPADSFDLNGHATMEIAMSVLEGVLYRSIVIAHLLHLLLLSRLRIIWTETLNLDWIVVHLIIHAARLVESLRWLLRKITKLLIWCHIDYLVNSNYKLFTLLSY